MNIGTNRGTKSIWDDITTTFIQVCVVETLKRNMPNGHLSKNG